MNVLIKEYNVGNILFNISTNTKNPAFLVNDAKAVNLGCGIRGKRPSTDYEQDLVKRRDKRKSATISPALNSLLQAHRQPN